jgi:mannitol 2-dehydrogenase
MSTIRLCSETLGALGGRVSTPTYDRSRVTVGIVHIGVGGFHRAHQAMYLDRLLEQNEAHEWGICGVGLLPQDEAMWRALCGQDTLYTVLTRGSDGRTEARVVGSIVRYLFAPAAPQEVLGVLTDPRTRIVSLTITEGGYNTDPVTGRFDPHDPAVLEDARNPGAPRTVFGYVVEALRRRRAAGTAPFTVMSCDNIQGNGDVARAAFAAFAALRDPGLGEWVRTAVAFPNSMVDRIAPATTAEDIADLREQFGVEDAWPVVCEPFTQWVLEDDFPTGRPAWERSGVQLTDEVEPYELMKLRLLNAGHQALAYAARLSGYTYAHEAARDPVFADFLTGYMTGEAAPTLEPVPGIDLGRYIETLIERFANPAIRDTVARLCSATSDRIPKWLLPVVRDGLAHGRPVTRSIAVIACWARYAEGVDEDGAPIDVVDALRDELMARARAQRASPLAFVENTRLFGDLAAHDGFARTYREVLESLHTVGAHATLRRLNADLAAVPGAV